MSESTVGMLVLLGITFITSVIVHIALRKFLLACLIAAVVSTALFEIAVFIQLGHMDKFIWIATTVALVVTFTVSAIVGFGVRKFRVNRGGARSGPE